MREKRFYIAYGSNLHLEQMAHRCPTAEIVDAAVMRGWRLMFRGAENGAVATVERFRGGSVPVLVWEIQPEDERALDRYEGYPYLYRKEMLRIKLNGRFIPAMIYIMNEENGYGIPSAYYFNVIREGYHSAGFDTDTLLNAVWDSIKKMKEG